MCEIFSKLELVPARPKISQHVNNQPGVFCTYKYIYIYSRLSKAGHLGKSLSCPGLGECPALRVGEKLQVELISHRALYCSYQY